MGAKKLSLQTHYHIFQTSTVRQWTNTQKQPIHAFLSPRLKELRDQHPQEGTFSRWEVYRFKKSLPLKKDGKLCRTGEMLQMLTMRNQREHTSCTWPAPIPGPRINTYIYLFFRPFSCMNNDFLPLKITDSSMAQASVLINYIRSAASLPT